MGEGKSKRKRRICEREISYISEPSEGSTPSIPKTANTPIQVSAQIKQELTTKYVDVKPKTNLNTVLNHLQMRPSSLN